MTKRLACAALLAGLFASSPALAAERTVTLAVQNMYCAACPHTVKASLQAVPGVITAVVSARNKTAVVTYDDARTDIQALTRATTNAGYPSKPTS
jgi:periplasmic mercuric ion binding protein